MKVGKIQFRKIQSPNIQSRKIRFGKILFRKIQLHKIQFRKYEHDSKISSILQKVELGRIIKKRGWNRRQYAVCTKVYWDK